MSEAFECDRCKTLVRGESEPFHGGETSIGRIVVLIGRGVRMGPGCDVTKFVVEEEDIPQLCDGCVIYVLKEVLRILEEEEEEEKK